MTWFRRYWLYLLVFLLPYERIPAFDVPVFGSSVTVRLSYIVAGLVIVFFGWTAARTVSWWRWRQPYFWLMAYIVVATVSVAQGLVPKRGLVALAATAVVLATCVLVSQSVRYLNWMRLFRVLTVTAVVVCLFGLFQFFGDSLGLSAHITGLKPIYTKSVFGFPRIQSTGLEPLYFANFLLIPLLTTLTMLYVGRLRRWWWYVALGLYVYTLALTLSRGAMWGGVAGAGLIIGLLVRRANWRRTGLLAATVGLGVLATAGSIYAVTQKPGQHEGAQAIETYTKQSTTFTPSAGSADSDRVTNKRLALQAFEERPVLGFGLGNFGTFAKDARPDLYGTTQGEVTVNNEYYEVLAETGILGLGALVGFFVALLCRVWGAWQRLAPDDSQRVWLVALTGVLAAFAVQYYAFSTLYVMHIWVTIGLLLGLSLTPAKRDAAAHKA